MSGAHVNCDSVVAQVTNSTNIQNLSNLFRSGLPKDARENVLASLCSNGQDPLSVLDVRLHTLGVLYILSARLSASFGTTTPPPWGILEAFCERFDPVQARYAADRLTKLAKGIQRLAQHNGNPAVAIPLLRNLVLRFPPDPSYLTTIHPIFLLACVSTRNFSTALPVLSSPITNIDVVYIAPELTYNDNLTYHYLGGIALAALKRWSEAEEYFEICVTSPGTYPAALQMEALKKLRLVQLISTGKISNLPKYTNPLLIRLFKNTPYSTLIAAYPGNASLLREIVDKDRSTFTQDRNLGLINQALTRAPRWVLKKLTATYVTLNLEDIGKAVGVESVDEVRALLLSMIESNDISAQISSTRTVTFSDPPPNVTKAQVDAVLRDVQSQTKLLQELEGEVGRSKEFLIKVVKNNEVGWAGPAGEEELFSGMGGAGGGAWEDSLYS